LVTYSAYYTVIPGFDSVLWKLALAMVSSNFDFDRAFCLRSFLHENKKDLVLDQQVEAVKLLSEGKDVFVWFPTGLLPFVFDVKLGRTNAPLVDRSVVLVISPLCLIVHGYYFQCHLSIFSLNFAIVLRYVLLLNLQSQLTRPYTINTGPYFSPAVIY